MLYEKKPVNLWPMTKGQLAIQAFIIVIVVFLTYSYCAISGMMGDIYKINLLEAISGLAYIATAAAFVFALFQFAQNIKQKRQLAIADEAKYQIASMIEALNKLEIHAKTNLKNINKTIVVLSNLGGNFNELFNSMDEDIHKAIIRMKWQDMYFNIFMHKMLELNISYMLLNIEYIDAGMLPLVEIRAHHKLNERKENANIFPEYEQFFLIEKILEDVWVKENIKLDLDETAGYLFMHYFLVPQNLKDVMQGTLNRIDGRVQAPLITAILYKNNFFENYHSYINFIENYKEKTFNQDM